MRTFVTAAIFSLFFIAFCSPLAAQNNPMPYVSNPVVPAATTPGGPGFTLTVNGAGFVNGAVVKWNDNPRATTFVSGTQLKATILASDIVTPGTIFISASNPAPGGGMSNSVFFQVTTPTQSLAFTRVETDLSTSLNLPSALTVFDYRNTGDPYLAVANDRCPANINCILQHAAISISLGGLGGGSATFTAAGPGSIASGDFNGDGLLDLITSGSGISISLNLLPPGTWSPHKDYPFPSGCSNPIALGDFNQDGHLDVALSGSSGPCVLPGNGDGTFGAPVNSASATSNRILAVGDFNGDGKLDLATFSEVPNTISILLGNGDGTFQSAAPVGYSIGPFPNRAVAADFNGDGHVDLALTSQTNVSIFLGNGDGTLKPRVDYPAGTSIATLTIGDYNGDGFLDLAVTDEGPANGSVNVILGNGDGTFQSHLDFAAAFPSPAIVTGEFYNGGQGGPVGRAGFATMNPQNNTVSLFVPIPTGPVNPLPTVSSFSPSSALVNSGAFTLTVNGTNFNSSSTVYFRDQPRVTTFVTATQLTAAIQAGDLASVGAVDVSVVNPTPGGGSSIINTFNVYGPPPTISSLSPSSVVAGGPAFTLTVNGLNFVKGASVGFNGSSGPTTFVSSTQLTIAILAAAIASQNTINVSVTNPLGNGGNGETSSSLPFAILPTNTQPVVGALVPASTNAGGPAFTLTLVGSGFTAGSIVTFKSSVVSSAFVSQTQLQAAIPASAIAVAGTPFVTVANPGGNPSLVTTFTVNNPFPGASSLSPSTVAAGNAAVTLSVTGANFNTSSAVLVNGSSRATTYESSTLLSAVLPATDFGHGGTLNISVNNPAPGGGSTSALTLIVEDFQVNVPAPTANVTAGQPANFNLMVVVPANTSTSNAITFTASGLPLGATANFSPSATIPSGSGSTAVTLTLSTTSRSSVGPDVRRPSDRRSLPLLEVWSVLLLSLGLALLLSSPRRERIFAPLRVDRTRQSALPSGPMAMALMFFTICFFAFQGGCGTNSVNAVAPVSSGSSSATPINIGGNWSFSTTSSKFVGQTTISGTIAQNGSNITGSLNISGSPCAQAGSFAGTLNGNSISASLNENGQTVTLAGTVSADGNSASGNYTAPAGGCTNGDLGTWAGTKSGTVSNPNGTPAGTYPITVTATSGSGSLSTIVSLTVR